MKTKKKQVEFLTFSRFTCFRKRTFRVNSLVLPAHIPYKKSEEFAPGLFIFEVFTGLRLSTPIFCMKGNDYEKHFVRVFVLLVINTGCPKHC